MNKSVIKRLNGILSKTQELKENKLWTYTDAEKLVLIEAWLDALIKDI